MYDRILVALDESETSQAALQEAIRLALQTPGATLRLVVVAEIPAAALSAEGVNLGAVEHSELESARKVLGDAVAVVKNAGLDAEAATPEALGTSVPEAIVEDARQWNAGLIVIGTHGRRGFQRLLLGSVAEGVARTADRPVLLVRHPEARKQR